MMRVVVAAAGVVTLMAGVVIGQSASPAPQLPSSTSAEVAAMYTNIAGFIAKSAAMIPAEKYTWQPTPEVRTYARLFAPHRR
jgi:hypothetical protein